MEKEKFGKIELINGNCMDILPSIPDNYFDLAICDPPYGIGASKPTIKSGFVKQKHGSSLYVPSTDYTIKDWDKSIPSEKYFEELERVSKHQIIFGINYYVRLRDFGVGRIVWNKMNGRNDQFGCEIAYCSLNKRTDIVNYLWSGMMQGKVASENVSEAIIQISDKRKNEKRYHPTQKPVKLYEWLLSKYCKSGYKILDTHLGAGSICLAVDNMVGLEMLGIELDPEYYKVAKHRLINHQSQLRLF